MRAMMDLGPVLTSVPVMALLAYALTVVALALAVQPLRLRMIVDVEAMLSEGHWNREQRDYVNTMLDSSTSISTGILLIIATIRAILSDLMRTKPDISSTIARLHADKRFDRFVVRYFISVLAANPICAVAVMPLMLISLVVHIVMRTGIREAIEEPLIASSVAAAHWRNLQVA